jgi:hypothetical protein
MVEYDDVIWYIYIWYIWYLWYVWYMYGMYVMVWYGFVCCMVLCVVWYCIVWYVMVWCGMVWYGMVWCGMVWYGMVWYGMVWYGIVCVAKAAHQMTAVIRLSGDGAVSKGTRQWFYFHEVSNRFLLLVTVVCMYAYVCSDVIERYFL